MSVDKEKINVCYVFRKPTSLFFSIEKIFSQIVTHLKCKVDVRIIKMPHAKLSLFNILNNFLLFRKIQTDIYHITGDVHYITLALPRKKVVLTIHDCTFLYKATGLKRVILKKMFLDWPVKKVAIITTISEKTKAEIIKYTGCPKEKIIVIPNPVSDELSYTKNTFNTESPRILFLGSTPNKNLKGVIAALKGIPCLLRIIGNVSEEQKRLLDENSIVFSMISGITEQELNEEYRLSDVILFPSLYEGFGLPIIEAQKTGRVVITSNLSPMTEVAGGGACLVDPCSIDSIRQGVLKVVNNNVYRESLIQEGFLNVKRFDSQHIAWQYLELYRKIASKN